MELNEAIFGRRSVRVYKDIPIEKDTLAQIMKAGMWAPTASNLQPWEFVCVTEPGHMKAIKTLSPGMFSNAKANIIVCCDYGKVRQKFGPGGDVFGLMDCSMAAQNMLLRAYELGIGTCVIKSFSQKAVKEYLGLPDDMMPELIIAAGYSAHEPIAPARKTDIIHWEKYERSNQP